MELLDALKTRRSCRKFTDRRVPDEQLDHLVETATLAPSARNLQPWAFALENDAAQIDALSEAVRAEVQERAETDPALEPYRELIAKPTFNFFHHAPALILVYGDTRADYWMSDAAMAAYHIQLRAHDLGLGTLWVGFARNTLDSPVYRARYNIPDPYRIVAPLAVGYPLRTEPRTMARNAPVIFYRGINDAS